MYLSLRTSILVGFFVALATIVIAGEAGAPSQNAAPLQARGTVNIEGTTYSFETEYWGDNCKAENGSCAQTGLHEGYLRQQAEYRNARTVEQLYACYTLNSKAWLDESAKVWPEVLAAQAKAVNSKVRNSIYICVIASDSGGEHLFVTRSVQGYMAMQKAGPSYMVSCLTKEDGRWKLDATLNKHPVRFELSEGRWKQFGAPQDMGDQEMRKRIRKQTADREHAATRPTSGPSLKD